MSQDDAEQLPSRGPKPTVSSWPISSSEDTEESTFQPSPIPAGISNQPSSKRRRVTQKSAPDPLAADSEEPVDLGPSTSRVPPGGPRGLERLIFGKVGSAQLARFCRQLASYLAAGVSINRSLSALEKLFRMTAIGPVIGRIQNAVRAGDSIADAVDREPQAFDRLARGMIRVAEARGGMPEILRELAEHYESRIRLVRQAQSALIYPTIALVIALGVGYLLTTFVIPPLVEILLDVAGREARLPAPTRLLIALSNFMTSVGYWLVPVASVASVVGLIQLYKTKPGKAFLDRVMLRVPVLGKLLRLIDATRFARTLATLLDAGVDFLSSMQLTAEVMHSTPFQQAVSRSRRDVKAGKELSEAIARTRMFDREVIEVIITGEETGKTAETLSRLADEYSDRVDRMVANLGQLIQPILTLIIGGFVFFIALAFVLAYITVISGLSSGL